MKEKAVRSRGLASKILPSLVVMTFILVWSGCGRKTKIPGQLFVLAQGNVFVITQSSIQTLVTDVAAAALSPDGNYLLYALKDQTLLRDLSTGLDRAVLNESARTMGWNADGSRFFIVTGCETNRLFAGRIQGNVMKIFQGGKALYGSEDDSSTAEEMRCGELGSCLFLAKNTLVFSAFDGPMPRRTDEAEIFANKAFLIQLDATPPLVKTTDFPNQERWKFVDVSKENDSVLLSVERNPENLTLFEHSIYVTPLFHEWSQISFQNEIQQNITRWENGSWGVEGELALIFTPKTNRLFGLGIETTDKGPRQYFIQIDPESGQTVRGADMESGQIINRPVFDPEERYAAILMLVDQGTREHVTILDLPTNERFSAWEIKAPKGYAFDAKRDRLLAWIL